MPDNNKGFVVGQKYGDYIFKDPKDAMVKEWTTDNNKGDKTYFSFDDKGRMVHPIWYSETEYAQSRLDERISELTNPNSGYYKSIGKTIRNTLSGAYSPNSILALTIAQGGSASQAAEQMKALEGRMSDTAGNLMNQYYLGASGQANSLLGLYSTNAQFLEQQRHALEQYKDQQRKGIFGDVLSTVGQIAGYALAPATGGASILAAQGLSLLSGGGSGNTPLNSNYNWTNGQGFYGMYQNRYGKSPGVGGY